MWKSTLHHKFLMFLFFVSGLLPHNSSTDWPFCRLWASPKSKPWRFFSAFYKWLQNNQLTFLYCLLQIIKNNRSNTFLIFLDSTKLKIVWKKLTLFKRRILIILWLKHAAWKMLFFAKQYIPLFLLCTAIQ